MTLVPFLRPEGLTQVRGQEYPGQLYSPGAIYLRGKWRSGKSNSIDLVKARDEILQKVAKAITQTAGGLSRPGGAPVGPGFAAAVQTLPSVVLAPKKVIPAFVEAPKRIMPRSIIPPVIESPTLLAVSDERQTGLGEPWTTAPAPLHKLVPVVGALMVYAGKKLLLAVALEGAGLGSEWLLSLRKTIQQRGITMRVHTGRTKVGTQTGEDTVWTAQPYPTSKSTGDSYLDALGQGFDNLYGIPR